MDKAGIFKTDLLRQMCLGWRNGKTWKCSHVVSMHCISSNATVQQKRSEKLDFSEVAVELLSQNFRKRALLLEIECYLKGVLCEIKDKRHVELLASPSFPQTCFALSHDCRKSFLFCFTFRLWNRQLKSRKWLFCYSVDSLAWKW